MLEQLHITNYAIIDTLDICFDKGLNIITGETGAGKSIILGALSLVLGERADTAMIINTDKKTIIEAIFRLENESVVSEFLYSKGYTKSVETEHIIIRRELNAKIKISRSFINDTMVTLSELSELAALLIDLHQQFDTFKINDYVFQIHVLDTLADNTALLKRYREKYEVYNILRKELHFLQSSYETAKEKQDYLSFVYEELERMNLQPDELETLDEELKITEHSVAMETLINKMLDFVQEGEKSVLAEIGQFVRQFRHYGTIKKAFEIIAERLDGLRIEMSDLIAEVARMRGAFTIDEKRIQWLNERTNEGFRLLKKYNVKTTNELLNIQEETARSLADCTNRESVLQQKKEAVVKAYKEAKFIADELSFRRKKYAKQVESNVAAILAQLGMPNAAIRIQITRQEELNEFGADNMVFLADTNKNLNFEPIGKIASGGELSRIMLAIKSLVAHNLALPTLVFDEIDTGVSGEVAKQIGFILGKLSHNIQIICITHQPTIAAKGDKHFHIYKSESVGKITTQIQKLSLQERVVHIAKMLGGDNPSEQMLVSAKELLNTN